MRKEADVKNGAERQMVWSYDSDVGDKGLFNDAFYLLDDENFELKSFFPIEDHDWDWTGGPMYKTKEEVKAVEDGIRSIYPIKSIEIKGMYFGKKVEVEFGFPAYGSSFGRIVSLYTQDGADLESLSEAMDLHE